MPFNSNAAGEHGKSTGHRATSASWSEGYHLGVLRQANEDYQIFRQMIKEFAANGQGKGWNDSWEDVYPQYAKMLKKLGMEPYRSTPNGSIASGISLSHPAPVPMLPQSNFGTFDSTVARLKWVTAPVPLKTESLDKFVPQATGITHELKAAIDEFMATHNADGSTIETDASAATRNAEGSSLATDLIFTPSEILSHSQTPFTSFSESPQTPFGNSDALLTPIANQTDFYFTDEAIDADLWVTPPSGRVLEEQFYLPSTFTSLPSFW